MEKLMGILFCTIVFLALMYAMMRWGIPADYDDRDDEEK